MRLLALALLLSQVPPGAEERAKKLAAQVRVAKPESRSDEARRVIELLGTPERWAAGFRTVEEKIGAFSDDTAVEVTFDYDGREFAKMAGDTKVRFNLTKLEEYRRKLDALDRQRQELAKQGKKMVFRLPPAKLERFVPHELCHVLQKQRKVEAPEWFEEGLAQWVGDDPNVLIGFALAAKKVDGIESSLSDPEDVYARGHLFFLWLDSKNVLRKAVRAVFFESVPWKKALEDASGLAWEKLVAAEREWSLREVEKLRPKEK
ncbi:MAG TPA: hypothetical protein VNM14_01225 [Planctomycetota bacterium]|nr:hypothetical protein [Planctomycetota bacterium]